MKIILRILVFSILPCIMYGQYKSDSPNFTPQASVSSSRRTLLKPEVADLTIIPDSVYFTKGGAPQAVIEISNNTNQPINLLQVQSQCSPCQGGWGWWVDSISVSTPHYIYPGQHVTVILRYWTIIKDEPKTNYLHDSMYIVSSVGTQYCHIFLDPSLISSIGNNVRNDFILFPNPVASKIMIKSNDNFNGYGFLTIYNSNGRKIRELELTLAETEINLNWMPNGMYLFNITDGNIYRIHKVVKIGN